MGKDKLFPNFFDFIKQLQLTSSDMAVYRLLLDKPMTIEQLKSKSGLSERTLRTDIDELLKKNFVTRKIVADKRIKYVYYANPPESMVKSISLVLRNIEKKKLKMRKDILKGSGV